MLINLLHPQAFESSSRNARAWGVMSKRSVEEEAGGFSFSQILPEIKTLIYDTVPLSDPGTLAVIILLDKESFSLVRNWCKRFLESNHFPNALPLSIGHLISVVERGDEYFTRENLYLILKLIATIADKPCKPYHKPAYFSFARIAASNVSDYIILDETNHCFTPIMKRRDLLLETYEFERYKSEEEMGELEYYAYCKSSRRYDSHLYSINESNARRMEITDPKTTPLSQLLVNGKHILSKRNHFNKLIYYSHDLRRISQFTFFLNHNIRDTQKQCYAIVGKIYQCVYCDFHDIDGCTYHE